MVRLLMSENRPDSQRDYAPLKSGYPSSPYMWVEIDLILKGIKIRSGHTCLQGNPDTVKIDLIPKGLRPRGFRATTIPRRTVEIDLTLKGIKTQSFRE